MARHEALRRLASRPRVRATRRWVQRNRPGGRVRWGSLRRTAPFSGSFGYDRGSPVDRVFIDAFVAEHAHRLRGDVLEVRDASYVRAYGDPAARVRIVDIDAGNPRADLVADLTQEGSLPAEAFDAIVLTETLHLTRDDRAGFRNAYAALRPGGCILFTGPCVSRLDPDAEGFDGWRYTPIGLGWLLQDELPEARCEVRGYGNVLTATAALMGLAERELRPGELAEHDPDFPVLVAALVVKPA